MVSMAWEVYYRLYSGNNSRDRNTCKYIGRETNAYVTIVGEVCKEMLVVHSGNKGGRSIELNTLVVTVAKRVEEVYIDKQSGS